MTIAYAAYTEGCTFLLDEAGVCRRALLKRSRPGERTPGGHTPAEAARLCVGAQYVASIDVREPGGLVPKPRVGTALLFAYVAEGGRIGVVRTGPLVRFESLVQDADADHDSGVRERPEPEPSETTLRIVAQSDEPLRDDTLPDPDDDDGQLTVPLGQSGERPSGPLRTTSSRPPPPRFASQPVPRPAPRFASQPVPRPAPRPSPPRPAPDAAPRPSPQTAARSSPHTAPRPTTQNPPRPSPRSPPRPSWDAAGRARHVALQRVAVVSPSESAPTLDDATPPAGRGMLPRGHRRA